MSLAIPIPGLFAAVLVTVGCGSSEVEETPAPPAAIQPQPVPAPAQGERTRQHRLKLQQEVERQRLAHASASVPASPVPTPIFLPTDVYTGPTVTLSLEDVGLEEAAAMVARQADIQVKVLGNITSRRVSVVADKQPVGSTIQAIAVSAGAVWWRTSDGGYCIATREWCRDSGATLTPSSAP